MSHEQANNSLKPEGAAGPSRRKCFVVSPIGPYGSEIRAHMDTVFHCIVEPALSDRYEVVRGDQITRPGRITEQIVADLIDNDLIVCVLTGQNPNVFYELAIAESAARPIIVLRHRGEEAPFDVKDVRVIEYDLEPRRIFDKDYVKMLRNAEDAIFEIDNYQERVPFAPSLTPLGRGRLNFHVAERYDLISRGVEEILAAASERFFFCGVSLRGWIGNEGFLAKIEEQANAGVNVKILLMGINNPAIGQMLNRDVRNQQGRICGDINESYIKLKSIKSSDGIVVRLVENGIIYQQMAMSENSMIWAPHLYRSQTGSSPAIRVDLKLFRGRPSGLELFCHSMRQEFEQLWVANAEVEPERPTQNE